MAVAAAWCANSECLCHCKTSRINFNKENNDTKHSAQHCGHRQRLRDILDSHRRPHRAPAEVQAAAWNAPWMNRVRGLSFPDIRAIRARPDNPDNTGAVSCQKRSRTYQCADAGRLTQGSPEYRGPGHASSSTSGPEPCLRATIRPPQPPQPESARDQAVVWRRTEVGVFLGVLQVLSPYEVYIAERSERI